MEDYKTKAIQNLVEDSWDRDDEGEYLLPIDRRWLIENNVLEQWRWAYFNELESRYQGTCNSLNPKDESFLEEFDMFSELDNAIFECACCGWWYETSEMGDDDSGENKCENCVAEESE